MKQQQPTKKTVTIIYGSNDVKKKRVLERLLENKKFHEFKEQDMDESGRLIFSGSVNIFYTKCSDIAAFEPLIFHNADDIDFQARIFSKDGSGKLTEVAGPELIIENTSFTPDDVAYFSKMEHVSLIQCF